MNMPTSYETSPKPADFSHLLTSTASDLWFLSGATRPDEDVRHLAIDENPFMVGRKSGMSISLNFRTVSGHHASLWVENGELFIKDQNSTNGTYVNGKKIDRPVSLLEEDLVHFAEAPFRVRRQTAASCSTGTIAENVCDQALALVQFDRLMSQKLVLPHFQPILNLKTLETTGFEILGRGRVFGLESVGAMFQAAERLNLEVELSSLLRWEGVRLGRDLPGRPQLYVNTHPKEMNDNSLIESLGKLREMAGRTPLVLEIHEAAVTQPAMMKRLHARLKDFDIKLAYDDFGAGQARLSELIEAPPDILKFDISLIRGIDRSNSHRIQLLESLVRMVKELNILALGEGIETAEEAAVCEQLGFDLVQGYYYGRPNPI